MIRTLKGVGIAVGVLALTVVGSMLSRLLFNTYPVAWIVAAILATLLVGWVIGRALPAPDRTRKAQERGDSEGA